VPRCLEAAHALQPIWSQAAEKPVTFATSLEHAKSNFASMLEDLSIDIPKELDK
jgi:propane monooxygenase small subunit